MIRRILLVALLAALTGLVAVPPATAAPTVTAKIVLASTEVAAGRPVRGTLVLTNPGARAVNLNDGCRPQWDVVLGRGRTPPEVAFAMVCAPEPFRVRPGTSKRPFRIPTTTLRAGSYRAFLVASQASFPTAAPVKVRIVRGS